MTREDGQQRQQSTVLTAFHICHKLVSLFEAHSEMLFLAFTPGGFDVVRSRSSCNLGRYQLKDLDGEASQPVFSVDALPWFQAQQPAISSSETIIEEHALEALE